MRSHSQRPLRSKKPRTRGKATQVARSVGSFIRTAREMSSLTQTELAKMTSKRPGRVSQAMISAIEAGRHLPGLESLATLSEILKFDASEVHDIVARSLGPPVDVTGTDQAQLRADALESFRAGDFRKAAATYDAMLQRLALDPPENADEARLLRADIEINRAIALRRCNAVTAARAATERALDLSYGVAELQARAYIVLAGLLSIAGRTALAKDAAKRAVELSQKAKPLLQAQAWNEMGNVQFRAGRYAAAQRSFVKAGELARNDPHLKIKLFGNLGSCEVNLGRPGHARARFRRAIALSRKHESPASEAMWLVSLGRVEFAAGDHDDADALAQQALIIARPRGYELTIFRAEWLRHRIAAARPGRRQGQRRLTELHRLFSRLRGFEALTDLAEFKREFVDDPDGSKA